MALSPELLEILRCPKCKSKVELQTDASGLRCENAGCGLVYPIRDEIPVMLIEEAKDNGKRLFNGKLKMENGK